MGDWVAVAKLRSNNTAEPGRANCARELVGSSEVDESRENGNDGAEDEV